MARSWLHVVPLNLLRISNAEGNPSGTPYNEVFYHFHRNLWYGTLFGEDETFLRAQQAAECQPKSGALSMENITHHHTTLSWMFWWMVWYVLYCPVMLSHFSPASVKQIMQYESNKPIKSKFTYRQSINQSTDRLQ